MIPLILGACCVGLRSSAMISGIEVPYTTPTLKCEGHLLIGVLSAKANEDRRDYIRHTWGRDACLIFVIASERPMKEESLGDVMRVHRREHFINITYQTQAMMHAALSFRGLRYLVKTDDDSEILVGDLHPKYDYSGNIVNHMRVDRHPGHKYFVDERMYPDDFYPPFARGAGYAVSKKFLRCATLKMKHAPFLMMEDVSTALLARSCGMEPKTLTPKSAIRHKTKFGRRKRTHK